MNKTSLANIIYQKALQRSQSQCLGSSPLIIKQKFITNNKKADRMIHMTHPSNKMIKITQFNSNLIVREQPKNPIVHLHSPSSPYRQYSVKKGKNSKSKLHEGLDSVIEMEISRRQREYCKSKSAKETQREEEPKKILMTSKWRFRNQLWDLDYLTNHLNNTQSVVVVKPDLINDDDPKGTKKLIKAENKRQFVSTKTVTKTSCSKQKLSPKIEFQSSATEVVRAKNGILRKISFSPRKSYFNQQRKYQQKLQQQKKQLLQNRKELTKNYAKPFHPPENVSAFAYIVFEADSKKTNKGGFSGMKRQDSQSLAQIRKLFLHSHKVLVSLNSRTAVEMASLTKIMTCIVAIELADRFKINTKKEEVAIGVFEQNIGGTSASIQKGQIYTIYQLLHGLMLPSGNDASLAIAVWGGKSLLEHQNKQEVQTLGKEVQFKKRQCYYRFIAEMNAKAAQLNMQKTKYANSHGLSNPQNRSCCLDLSILCEYAMNNQTFREIVACRQFQGQIKIEIQGTGNNYNRRQSKDSLKGGLEIQGKNEKDMEMQQMKDMEGIQRDCIEQQEEPPGVKTTQIQTKEIRWENTHQLLQSKPFLYTGIKTGVTTTAGPCLASCIEVKGRRFISIVLNCKTMKQRMKDTQILRKWTFQKLNIKEDKIKLKQVTTS